MACVGLLCPFSSECSSDPSNAVDSSACSESFAEKLKATNKMGGQPLAAKGLSALHMQDAGHVDLSFASSDGLAGDDETSHRCADNSGCSGALGMVTRIISPREPEFHSKRGKAAIDAAAWERFTASLAARACWSCLRRRTVGGPQVKSTCSWC